MSIDRKALDKLADLAHLELTDEQANKYLKSFNKLLESLNILEKVDVHQVTEQSAAITQIYTPCRPDLITEHPIVDDFQKIAPKVSHHYYLVPKVIEGDSK